MEPVQLAKVARESLAAALNAIQSCDDAPDELFDAAEPIAQTITILRKIERGGGAMLDGRDVALKNVRKVLADVQNIDGGHPAADEVLEAVAASLAKVNALARWKGTGQPSVPPPAPSVPPAVSAPAPAPKPAPAPVAAPPPEPAPAPQPVVQAKPVEAQPAPVPQPVSQAKPVATQPSPGQVVQAKPIVAPPPEPAPAPQPVAQPKPVVVAQPEPRPVPQPVVQAKPAVVAQPEPAPAPQPVAQPKPVVAAQPEPAPVLQPLVEPKPLADVQPLLAPVLQPVAQAKPAEPKPAPAAPAPAHAAPAPAAKAASKKVAAPPAPPGVRTLEVSLGTRSVSNFYRGLNGNDVIEHGGVFVETYRIPKIGTQVQLHVHMPGDYEFYALATVMWTRESGGSSEPGFGARFTQIGDDGRQLVFRYSRIREPMFYDDL